MELPRRYTYNPKWWVILACALFFGACAALLAHRAAHNSSGRVLLGIRLGPTGATTFYWAIAALSGLFVVMALLLTARRIASHQVLELGAEALLLPHGFLQTQTARIPYVDIEHVSEVRMVGETFLYVTAGGHRFTITASLLPDTGSYMEVRNFLLSLLRYER